jgi:hypothetical protein
VPTNILKIIPILLTLNIVIKKHASKRKY